MAPPIKKKRIDSSEQDSRNAEDMISALPDFLLHHILSFLKMRKVVATSLLSRRWRYLWKSTPTLDFVMWDRWGRWSPSSISKALSLYEGMEIRELRIRSNIRDDDTSHADSWIYFAVLHNVEKLDLNFIGDAANPEEAENSYMLHCFLFTCESIRVLKLTNYNLNLPTSVHLSLLKTIELWYMKLTDVEIKALTSGCPLLENIALMCCNSECNLNIFAPNVHLKSLVILDDVRGDDSFFGHGIEIFAPYVLSLELSGFMRSYYNIYNLSSIASVSIAFDKSFHGYYEGEDDQLVALLSDLSHAKTLTLCNRCVQVLSRREVVDAGSLYLRATCLELKTGLRKWDCPGMTYLLQSSHNLESLIINLSKTFDICPKKLNKYPSDEREYWELLELSSSCQLSHLKTVKIYGFLGSRGFSWAEHQSMDIDDFMQRLEMEVELLRFLLMNCKMLDKVIVSISTVAVFPERASKSEVLLDLTKRLLLLPRASSSAKIFFS